MGALPRTARIALTATTAAVTVIGLAPAAIAAPGDWTQLSTFSASTTVPNMTNTVEPAVGRYGGSLQVVWAGTAANSKASYFSAQLDGAGAVTMPSREILSNWDTLTGNPALITVGGQRFLGFSGLQPGFPGAQLYATSPDGAAWTVGPGSMSASNSAYAAYGNDVVDNAGTPVWTGNPGSVAGVFWHSGIAGSIPAPFGSDGYIGGTGCCAYAAASARDTATGAVWTAYYSNASATSEAAIQVGQILPTQGALTQAPGSLTVNDYGTNSISPDNRVPMAARPGGGVYVAYSMGYPTVDHIRIWQVGTGTTLDVPGSSQAGRITLAADPAGRLWVQWISRGRVKVVHTNPAATAFGSVGDWGAPANTDSFWHSATDAADGVLDVVVTSNASGAAINVWHTQATRTLTVSASPSPVRRGRPITVRVTDAGAPVAGAVVKLGSRSATTNAAGKATIRAGSRGGFTVSGRKAGFNTGTTAVRVR